MTQKTVCNTDIPMSSFLGGHQLIEPAHFSSYLVESTFNPENYSDQLFSLLNIPFPQQLKKAVTSRRAEFLAGRSCAHYALQKLGIPVAEIPIGANRCPVWPPGIRASITHASNRAVCAASKEAEVLGVDFETTIKEQTAREIKQNLVSPAEETLLSKSGLALETWLTIAFSAKESLFKAIYSKVGQYFDFLDAEILVLSVQQQKLELRILRDLSPTVPTGSMFIGAYQPHQDGILSIVEHS
ncbi:4'-phosphopantetheinyl transferase superfamily protein [Microbulbifer sp. OS29]|uniref:Enterobactin synthase component D n=1 Tax=Microbulbifer okhotskensis TaxID=2926617 RepID=A0A9X2EMM5_9GAMM|nr:4'-phosphopantetheinyl transferase superfamily protein [Microbulbifer okhotskensis]MCO1334526.1 4'-phosphopantetheinyl transferase superfamily protein [Microbulbifer okhotskensis]